MGHSRGFLIAITSVCVAASCGNDDRAATTTIHDVQRGDAHSVELVAADATESQLEASVGVLTRRLEAAGYTDAVVIVQDGAITVASRKPLPTELMEAIARPGKLEFRLVVDGPIPSSFTVPPTTSETTPQSLTTLVTGTTVVTGATLAVGSNYCESLVDGVRWLYDAQRFNCYDVGESLLPDPDIVSSTPRFENDAWIVEVEFGDDRFVELIAEPYVDQSIAIVVDDVVLSAPHINEGITGRNVQISGDFREAEATGLAAALTVGELLPVDFEVIGGDPTPTTEPDFGLPTFPTVDGSDRTPPLANRDHWHAALGVNVCGSWLVDAPEFNERASAPGFLAGVHSHGDGLIHMHPYTDDEAGNHATLRTFLEEGGWMGEHDGLDLWAPTDQCGAGADPVVRYFVNREAVDDGLDYKFADQDTIVIAIGGTGDPGAPPSAANLADPTDVGP
jgi:hypothetical protein